MKKFLTSALAVIMGLLCCILPKTDASAYSVPKGALVDASTFDELDKSIGCTESNYAYAIHLKSAKSGECQTVALANLIRRYFASNGVSIDDADFEYFSRYIFWTDYYYKNSLKPDEVLELARAEDAKTEKKVNGGINYYQMETDAYSDLGNGSHIYSFGESYNFTLNCDSITKREALEKKVDDSDGLGVLGYFTNSNGDIHWMVIKKYKTADGEEGLAEIGPVVGSYRMQKLSDEKTYTKLTNVAELKLADRASDISFEKFMNALKKTVKTPELKDPITCSKPSVEINLEPLKSSYKAGTSIYLKGNITAKGGATLKQIDATVTNSAGTVVETYSLPGNNNTNYTISTKTIDLFSFRFMPSDTYTLKITAWYNTPTMCGQKTYTTSFKIVGGPSACVNFSGMNLTHSTVMTYGKSFYMSGTISTTVGKFTKITGALYKGTDESKTPIESYSYSTSAKSVSITTKNIDKYSFRKLSRGTYTLVLYAYVDTGTSTIRVPYRVKFSVQ